ncbi:M50 family metallopeptidase [Candidatus Woesearchaeota archaeon]|nr:M50 family metallopeptidase [Candidatus Woesearchaeota archaeon]
MVFSLVELADLVVMIAAVAFIFKDSVRMPAKHDEQYDPLADFAKPRFDFEGFRTAVFVAGPAIALHELGHKMVALAAGIPAVFHANYLWLAVGVALKAVNSPFIFFVPGFVTHAAASPAASLLIGFAGPAVNLGLWLGSAAVVKWKKGLNSRALHILHMTGQINMFLFIFNMIPFPPFDGYTVFASLLRIAGVAL